MKKVLSLTLVCCLSTAAYALDDQQAQGAIQNIPSKGKILACEEMKLLNMIFKDAPIGLVHFKAAANAAKKILLDLPKSPDTPPVMAGFVQKLISPIAPFLNEVKKYAFILEPLVRQSLNAEPPAYLIGFVKSSVKGSAADYFKEVLKTKPELERACKEFMQFYLDIYTSIAPDTRTNFDQLWQQIVAEQKRTTK